MKKVRILTVVPKEDYDTFRELYPAYGAWTWFVRECLVHFNELHKETPTDLLREAMVEVKEEMAE